VVAPVDELPPELAAVDPPELAESEVCLVLEHALAARPMEMATASSDDVLLRLMLGFLSGCGDVAPEIGFVVWCLAFVGGAYCLVVRPAVVLFSP
jgi:hypothetical protein